MPKTAPAAIVVSLCAAALLIATPAARCDELSSEDAAARLSACTVTVRMLAGKSEAAPAAETAPVEEEGIRIAKPRTARQQAGMPDMPRGESVTVSSGVCVGPGLIVTFVRSSQQAEDLSTRFRITLADGEQARATLRVVDRYSGLILLEVTDIATANLLPAEAPPKVGSPVLSAAAAGIEKPLVSRGIVSGLDRSPGLSGLPPLLECDVRTTDTSSGAAIVDGDGRLLGVVAATSLASERAGWAYAVPVRYVQRLVAAKTDGDKPTILERRRASLGLALGAGPGEGTVEVEHVVAGGPAEKVGIRQGDLIVEADGRKIRSAYQLVDLILMHQPGDKLSLVIARGDERQNFDVLLAGQTAPLAAAAPENIGPQVKLRVVGPRQIEVEKHAGEVGFNAAAPAGAARGAGSELEMLKIQLSAFEKVIVRLQAELDRREAQQAATDELVDSLRRQVDALGKPADKADSSAD